MLTGENLVLTHVHADGGVLFQALAQQPQQPSGEHIAGVGGKLPAQLLPAEGLQLRPPGFAFHGDIPLQKLAEDDLHVTHQGYGRAHVLSDLRRVHVDVDVRHPALDLIWGKDGPVRCPGADHDQKVRFRQGLVGALVAVGADHAHVQRMLCGKQGQTHHGGDRGNARAGNQLPQFLLRTRQEHAAAGADHGTLRLGDGLRHPHDLLVVAPDTGVVAPDGHAVRENGVLHHLLLDIDRDVNEHRAGPAAGGNVKGLADDLGKPGGVLDQIAVFNKRSHCAGDIHLLEDVPAQQAGGHLPGDRHQGDRIHISGGNAGDEVGGAGAGGHDAHAGLSRDPGIARGHMSGILLGPNQGIADPGCRHQRIHNGTDGGAGVAENAFYPFPQEALHQNLCACHLHGLHSSAESKKVRDPGVQVTDFRKCFPRYPAPLNGSQPGTASLSLLRA